MLRLAPQSTYHTNVVYALRPVSMSRQWTCAFYLTFCQSISISSILYFQSCALDDQLCRCRVHDHLSALISAPTLAFDPFTLVFFSTFIPSDGHCGITYIEQMRAVLFMLSLSLSIFFRLCIHAEDPIERPFAKR